MMYVLCFIVVFLNNPMSAMGTAINYGKAITQAQANNWDGAQTSINKLLVDQPTRTDLLYDAGVAAYRLQEYPKAQAYFEHVTQSDAPLHLKEQAYFNVGNAHVQQKQLKDAIVAYELVLDINPDNERARHNLEIVKQMLQEQQQQKQEQKQDQQDQQKQQQSDSAKATSDKQKEQRKDQQQNQQKGESENQDNKNQDDQNTDGQQAESDQNGEQQKQNDNKHNRAQNNADQNGQQDKQADNTGSQEQDGHEQEQQLEKNSQQGTSEQEQRANQHKKSPEQKNQPSHDMSEEQQDQTNASEQFQSSIDQASVEQAADEAKKNSSGKKAIAQNAGEDEKLLDPKEKLIHLVLQQQEDADAQANKRMIKRAIDKNLAGQHGQKRW